MPRLHARVQCAHIIRYNGTRNAPARGSTLTNALGHTFCDQVHLSIFRDAERRASRHHHDHHHYYDHHHYDHHDDIMWAAVVWTSNVEGRELLFQRRMVKVLLLSVQAVLRAKGYEQYRTEYSTAQHSTRV